MDDLRELYQETILDHNKKPRNFRVLDDANREADGRNPLCGDELTLYARVSEDGRVEEVTFQGSGCAISKKNYSACAPPGRACARPACAALCSPPITAFCSMTTPPANRCATAGKPTRNAVM